MNKLYYLKVLSEVAFAGPFTFKEACADQNWWQDHGYRAIILKVVVNENGVPI